MLVFFGLIFVFIRSTSFATDGIQMSVTILKPVATTESGDVDYASLSLDPVEVFPSVAQAGAVSNYSIEFPVGITIPAGGKIIIGFPSGFSFTSACSQISSDTLNADINGSYDGTVRIGYVTCNSGSSTITISTSGGDLLFNTVARFALQGIVNATEAREVGTSSGYFVGIRTYSINGDSLEEKTAAPFFLEEPGNLSVSGTIFLDNGVGGGVANDNIRNGLETGVGGIDLCLVSDAGHTCDSTSTNGGFVFDYLKKGAYRVNVPPLSSGQYLIAQSSKDVELAFGQSLTGVNFALRVVQRTVTVSVSGIPDSTDLSVFAFDSAGTGGSSRTTLSWNGSTSRTLNIPVQDGIWDIGIEPTTSRALANFVPPRPQTLQISGSGSYGATFIIPIMERKITGMIVDATLNPISGAYVVARPSAVTGTSKERVTESKKDGTFEIYVTKGTYTLSAGKKGMISTNSVDLTVASNINSEDGNESADVFVRGKLIINDGDMDVDDLFMKLLKGQNAISGKILNENGGVITNAFVEASRVSSDGEFLGKIVGTPTDATGTFLVFVENGRWKLRAFAPGYGEIGQKFVQVAGLDSNGQNIQVSATAFGQITGTVTKNGTGVSGAFVTAFNAEGTNGTVTDEKGNYSLKVRSGSGYSIESFLPGFGSLPPIKNVTVAGGGTISGQDFTMEEPGTIRVTMDGVTDAFVKAVDGFGFGNSTSANPTPGVYDIQVPAGTYTIFAHSTKYGSVGKKTNVIVAAGSLAPISFEVDKVFTISGSVMSDSSFCVNSSNVLFTDTTNGRSIFTQTDDLGAYSMTIPEGTYELDARKPGCLSTADPLTVVVSGADVLSGTRITLKLSDTTIAGQVQLDGANVTFDTKVIAKNSDGEVVLADVDVTGTGDNYSLSVKAGTWTLTARADGYETSPVSLKVVQGESADQAITMNAIAGYVIKEEASVMVTPSRGGVVKNANLGDDFELSIPAGALGGGSDSGSVKTKETTAIVPETKVALVVGNSAIEIKPVNSDGEPIKSLAGSGGVNIKIPYTKALVDALGKEESDLVLATWSDDAQEWIPLPTTVDTVNKTLSAMVSHFSLFAPIVPAKVQEVASSGGGFAGQQEPGVLSGGIKKIVEKLVLGDSTSDAPTAEEEKLNDEQDEEQEVKSPTQDHPITAEPLEVIPFEEESEPEDTSAPETEVESGGQESPQETLSSEPVESTPIETESAGEVPALGEVVDLQFAILDTSEIVSAGDRMKIDARVRYQGDRDFLTLHYQILNSTGEVVFDELELLSVSEAVRFIKSFRISEYLSSGHYTLFVKTLEGDRLIEVHDFFQVVGTSVSDQLKKHQYIALKKVGLSTKTIGSVFALVITLFVMGEILWFFLKKRRARRRGFFEE